MYRLSLDAMWSGTWVGHMVHHAAPDKVMSAIGALSRARWTVPPAAALDKSTRRNWLHIAESLEAA